MDFTNKTTVRPKNVTFSVKPKKIHKFEGKYGTFQAAMKFPVLMGQFFGLNPVVGVSNLDASKLRFSYLSGRCIYTFITIFGQVCFLNGLFCLKYFKDAGTSVGSNTTLIFYSTNTVTTILFLRIATKWPKLCQHISKTEAADPMMDTTVVRKCTVSCVVVMALAVVEHSLSELSGFAAAADCQPDNIYEAFVTHNFPWVDHFFNDTHVFGAITQFLNIQCTFNWNFSNLFVICISFYLTARLEQINKKVSSIKGKLAPSTFWRSIREEYNRATNLVRRVDEVISGIIFISFANNLFFICFQLLHTLADGIKATPSCHIPDQRPFKGYEETIYFTYSLIFLILRSLAVCLIASEVNTASRQPVYALYEVPSSIYCSEVQRFIEKIHSETISLSGLQFFNIKRGMVLAIAGTIVTYELVLLQFTGVTPTAVPLQSNDELV